MARPTGLFGQPEPYLPSVGQDLYDADDLPPVTAALRNSWGGSGSPVPSSEAMAAILVAVNALELRVAALES